MNMHMNCTVLYSTVLVFFIFIIIMHIHNDKAILVKRNLNFCVDHFLNQLDADDHIQIK